ncbi:cyclin N-terminal domain-containing protein 1 isoform X1 [Anas acuta]|uniref:cyclin N-terminal domain-containing protein 1 isoform X1 n=1 Tax=Anas acuta TaxID=28680 RepID=UPI0035C90C2F
MARMGSHAVPRFYSSEPLFGGVAPEVMEASLLRLAAENERYLSELPGQAGCCKDCRTVEFIFLLAEKWHLDHSARYQAVELLERFMIKQVEQVCKSPTENMEGTKGGSSWSSLKEQIYDTFVLRLVSCIQLASKLSLHYNIVNSNTALKFLQSLKYSYTKQELLESELAVLETLQFQINVSTPLAYIELLLEVLGHNGCLLPAKPLHQMCVQLLDFLYLEREAIYNTLLKTAIENSTPSELQDWNHQHKRFRTKSRALEAGCGAFKLHYGHHFTKHLRIFVCGTETRPWQHHAKAAAEEIKLQKMESIHPSSATPRRAPQTVGLFF